MRTAPVALALLASLGLVAYQTFTTRPAQSVARPASIDIGSVKKLGDALSVAPIDLNSPATTPVVPDAKPLARTEVLAPGIVKSAAPAKSPSRAAAPAHRTTATTHTSKGAPARPARNVSSVAPNASFTSALNSTFYSKTDLGFSKVHRTTLRGKAVRTASR